MAAARPDINAPQSGSAAVRLPASAALVSCLDRIMARHVFLPQLGDRCVHGACCVGCSACTYFSFCRVNSLPCTASVASLLELIHVQLVLIVWEYVRRKHACTSLIVGGSMSGRID